MTSLPSYTAIVPHKSISQCQSSSCHCSWGIRTSSASSRRCSPTAEHIKAAGAAATSSLVARVSVSSSQVGELAPRTPACDRLGSCRTRPASRRHDSAWPCKLYTIKLICTVQGSCTRMMHRACPDECHLFQMKFSATCVAGTALTMARVLGFTLLFATLIAVGGEFAVGRTGVELRLLRSRAAIPIMPDA